MYKTSSVLFNNSSQSLLPVFFTQLSASPPGHQSHYRHRRTYAQHATESSPEDPTWPQDSRHAVPTPYEIFRQKKGSPYSKRRFYELVKIYHPDRDIHRASQPGCLSRAVRLERYRLIIAANDILSDPTKRNAYDRWGAGWHGQPSVTPVRNARDPEAEKSNEYYDNFASAANNATWEDWERWYQQRDGKSRATPRWMSNENFVGLVVLFIFVGGSLELGRAARMSAAFKEQVDARHAAASDELRKRREAGLESGGRGARVQDFLRTRDTGIRALGERDMLPPPRPPNSGWK